MRRGSTARRGTASKPRPHPALQHVERFAADDDELHQVRRVVALVEVDQLVADVGAGAVGERRRCSRPGTPRGDDGGSSALPPRGEPAEPIVAAPRDVLRVHDLAFALDVLAVEPRGDEELGEAVERAFEVPGVDIEEVVRVGERGGGVARAAVLADEAAVLARVGILLGPEKQHVLEESARAPDGPLDRWRSRC